MDFATMMVIALTVCGVIWALDARLWAPRRRAALAAASAVSTGPLAEQDRQRIAKEPLPVVNMKVIDIGSPKRGDVVVFRFPEDPSVDYIKRIVGLPGDHIAYHDKTLFINGVAAPQQYVGPYTEVSTGIPLPAKLQIESIQGVEHKLTV